MSKREKKETEKMSDAYGDPVFELSAGFYLVDQDRNLRTVTRKRGKPGVDQRLVTEPIVCRTIQAAKAVVSAADNPLSILCVTGEQIIPWPCS